MTKEVMYVYLGTNGTICSPIHLEDIYYIRKIRLWADDGKVITKDGKNYSYRALVPEDEVNQWYEIVKPK
jgi:hypothetical protein